MNSSAPTTFTKKLFLLFILLVPYTILFYPLWETGLLISLLWLLFLFLLTAIIVSEATKKLNPGKEDYVLIPLLILLYLPIPFIPFRIIVFLVLGSAAIVLLIKKR